MSRVFAIGDIQGCLSSLNQLIKKLPFSPFFDIIIWFLIAAPWVELMRRGYGRFNSLICAMAIARPDSVTVSMAAEIRGMPSSMVRVRRVRVSTCPGSTEEAAGTSNTSSNVKASRMGKWSPLSGRWGYHSATRHARVPEHHRVIAMAGQGFWAKTLGAGGPAC